MIRLRKVTYSCAVSLDGYIATANGDVDWLMWCAEAAELLKDFATRFDTILMGRKKLLMGGGELAVTLAAAGLVDQLELNVHPITLGRGVPLFAESQTRTNFELIDSRAFSNGCVFSRYRLKAGE